MDASPLPIPPLAESKGVVSKIGGTSAPEACRAYRADLTPFGVWLGNDDGFPLALWTELFWVVGFFDHLAWHYGDERGVSTLFLVPPIVGASVLDAHGFVGSLGVFWMCGLSCRSWFDVGAGEEGRACSSSKVGDIWMGNIAPLALGTYIPACLVVHESHDGSTAFIVKSAEHLCE